MSLFGKSSGSTLDFVPVVLIIGQSNAVGVAHLTRLENTQFNYQGIAAGYPTARDSQPVYAQSPTEVKIYYKTNDPDDDMSLDNGEWQDYENGVNTQIGRGTSGPLSYMFGPDLSMMTQLQQYSGRTIYLVKCPFGSTALTASSTNSLAPGNWNYASRYVAMEYFLRRAIRDLRTLETTKQIRLVGVNWWQGEWDVQGGKSTVEYQAGFEDLYAYIKHVVEEVFMVEIEPVWNLVKLKFYENSNEDNINAAIENLVSAHSNFRLIDATLYPRKMDLTTAEALPLAVGTPNAEGWDDTNHNSYITQLSVGEVCAQNMIDSGLIKPLAV